MLAILLNRQGQVAITEFTDAPEVEQSKRDRAASETVNLEPKKTQSGLHAEVHAGIKQEIKKMRNMKLQNYHEETTVRCVHYL